MAFLTPDKTENINGVLVKEFLLTNHNVNHIDMPRGNRQKTVAVTIHNTDAINQAQGTTMSEQYTRATYYGNMKDVRVQYYVDDVEAWNCMPNDYVNWSCADGCANPNSGNNTSIAIEIIGNSAKAEDNGARIAAYLLKQYGLDVNNGLRTHTYWLNVKDGKTGSIDELNVMWNSYKNCPIYIIPHWQDFKAKVQTYLDELNGNTPTPQPTPTPVTESLYRVRKSWDDASSQVGAYKNLNNAKNACPEGYSVYDENGNAIYTKNIPAPEPTPIINITTNEVKELQTILNVGGAGLVVDGIVGPLTLNAAKKYTVEQGDTGNLIKWVQKRLNTMGYNCGTPDGIAGNMTMNGIYSFQKAYGLGVGYLGGGDWNYLLK
jgi:hypothetical protein